MCIYKTINMKNNRMTKLTTLILFLFIAVSATSQTRINAKDIMKDLKNGKTVSYKNATIVGVLDFTSMDEKLSKLPKRKSSWWGTGSNSNKIVEEIKGKVLESGGFGESASCSIRGVKSKATRR